MLAVAVAACLVVAACSRGQAARQSPVPPAATTSPLPSGQPLSSPPIAVAPGSVFLIIMENRSYGQALSGGYTATLAGQYGVATNYHGVSHPSLPNYLALTSGSTWGIADDGYHPLPRTGLGTQLTAAGVSWRAYMEGMSRNCLSSSYPYALKHDPFAYFGGTCPSQVVPFSTFGKDLAAGEVPQFVWITPGLCSDGHDCSTAVADRWLSSVVPQIMGTAAWRDGGVLIITWDEGEDATNHILTVVIRPGGGHATSSRNYNHYSLLATVEDRFGVPRLGQARYATPLTDLMISGSV